MSDDERNRSRSPSRRPDDDDFPGWDDSMTAMFDTMLDLLPNGPEHDVLTLVHKLATKGCNNPEGHKCAARVSQNISHALG